MQDFLNEDDIIKFWKSNDSFKTSLEKTKTCKKFNFYDGPPFATGLPHYGHIVANTIKDIIPRYKTQNGYYVERVFGWDTHGLPIEFEIEKMLGIKTKDDVLKFGIKNYNDECKKIVLKFREEWRETIERLGRWVDFDNDYKTMDTSFMESVWWVFKTLFDKKLVYRGVKVMPYSNGCTTPLSNFEATSNYKSVSDPSLTIKFKILDENYKNTFLMVWTTTPWTLISNLAVCVNPNLEYCIVNSFVDNNDYIIAKNCLVNYFKDDSKYKIVKIVHGIELKGLQYEPLFEYFLEQFQTTSFKIIVDTYVESNNGTGLVHVAPAFGKDDFRICMDNNIINKDIVPPCPINDNGCFVESIKDYSGVYIKDADSEIIKSLKVRNLVFTSKKENHEYPFCWRSNTPLIYKSVPSWFIRVEDFKDSICENNKMTHWVPQNIRDNKFGKWLENAMDWCVSRNRYWGTPIPIWTNEDFSEIVCIGSIEELELLSGLPKGSINDIHRHNIDNITIPSKSGNGVLRRISEVFDCWFESGSMPYAQHGYPKSNKNIDDIFPADFIAEGTDQTRGWFYTLMVISTALFNKPAFNNVIVNGLVLASDGEKMSKSKKNYPPVNNIFKKYGADAVRLYLISGPVVRAGDLKFKESDIKTVVKNVNILMYNMVKYLLQMIDLYQVNTSSSFIPIDIFKTPKLVTNSIDCWILQYTNKFIEDVHQDMDKYELYHIVDRITLLIDRLSRWYLKLNKPRFVNNDHIALSVFYYCIYHIIVTMAPFTPFLSEIIYQKIKHFVKGEDSVHYIQMKKSIWDGDISLLEPMENLFKVVNVSRVIRTKMLKRELKMPVNELIIVNSNIDVLYDLSKLENYIYDELNVMSIIYSSIENDYINYKLRINPKLGRIYKQKLKKINNYLIQFSDNDVLNIITNKTPICFEDTKIDFKDIIVVKEIKNNDNYYSHIEDDVLLLMDKTITEEMICKHQTKLIFRCLQDFRKECGLMPSDKISIYYHIIQNNIDKIHKLILDVEKLILQSIKYYDDKSFIVLAKTKTKDYCINDSIIRFYYEILK